MATYSDNKALEVFASNSIMNSRLCGSGSQPMPNPPASATGARPRATQGHAVLRDRTATATANRTRPIGPTGGACRKMIADRANSKGYADRSAGRSAGLADRDRRGDDADDPHDRSDDGGPVCGERVAQAPDGLRCR